MSDEIEIEIEEEVFLPKYRHLIYSDADIFVLWGGRDSGKSHFIAQSLVRDCLENEYFKCILTRKVQDTIKESQFETIKEIIKDWGLASLFDFVTHPLEIRCVNGNKFIARGADKGGKVKGVKDPTHAWFEEMNQLTKEEYSVVSTTLRGEEGTKIKEYWSFNPECEGDFKEFWLYDIVGEVYKDHREEREIDIDGEKVNVVYEFVHSTYNDNPHCPPSRKAKYLNTAAGDSYLYSVWINGKWGKKEVKAPFAHQFDRKYHTSTTALYDPNKIVYISIDFNIDPFTAIFFHIFRDREGEHCHVFDEVEIKGGSIDSMAKQIKERYGRHLHTLEITGDSMGLNRTITQSDNASLYTMLMRQLGISARQFKVPTNPQHRTSRDDCNYFLFHFPDFKINPEKCPNLVRDLEIVEVDMYGKIKKSNRQKEEQRADFVDDFRAMVNTFFGKWLKDHRNTNKGIPVRKPVNIDINEIVERTKL